MENIAKYTVSLGGTIIDVLRKLEDLSRDSVMAVFVVDDCMKIIGTITAGDIRRALIGGCGLESKVDKVMNVNFTYLTDCYFDVEKLKYIKEQDLKLVPVLDKDGQLVRILNFQKRKSFLPMDAVLMAGGKGERLRPLTEKVPKPHLKVGNKAIIDYNIDNLIDNGVENINVTVNYLAEQLEEHFSDAVQGIKIKCVREPQFLGTIGSIKFIHCWHNDTVLVMNSDLFTDIDLEAFFIHFMEHDADMSIAAVPYSVNVPYAILDIEGVRNIKSLREKPSFHYYANAGIYLIKRKLLDMIPEGKFFHATDFMEMLIESGHKVIRFPISGYWIDIGKPEDFNKVQDIANHIKK